ncbi:hypothetical protein IFM89_014832 [Coptis chinensis]|uniref:Transposase n=1 Tax=Coptis chinensis TaxID=261450 RepID=A0A835M2J0_9MAGN|nr:hypothetical protein IFM89_014832 [Coptis chinensis]
MIRGGGEIGFESQSEDGDGVEVTVVDQQVIGSSQACVEEVLSQFNDLFESGEAFEHDVEHGNNDIFLGGSSDDENDRQFEVVARFGPCTQDTFNLGDPKYEKEDEDWDPIDVHSSDTSEGSLVSDNEEEDTEMNNFVISTRNFYVEEDTERTDNPETTISKMKLKLKPNMEWRHIGECRQFMSSTVDEDNKVVQAKVPWVANELEAFARAHPTFALVDLFNEIYREYGVHISYWTVWIARIMLLEKMHDEFVGFFVAYKASLDGFVKGCKPIIGLDGCFLKGKHKGLIDGVATNFPYAYHKHMYNNFKTVFKGHYLESLCWGAAKAYRITTHEAFMELIEQANKDAKKWLEKESRKTWARSYFDLTPKIDLYHAVLVESFILGSLISETSH